MITPLCDSPSTHKIKTLDPSLNPSSVSQGGLLALRNVYLLLSANPAKSFIKTQL